MEQGNVNEQATEAGRLVSDDGEWKVQLAALNVNTGTTEVVIHADRWATEQIGVAISMTAFVERDDARTVEELERLGRERVREALRSLLDVF